MVEDAQEFSPDANATPMNSYFSLQVSLRSFALETGYTRKDESAVLCC
jgi:hypothetical protein